MEISIKTLPHLKHLGDTGRLIVTDYQYSPRRRDFSKSPFIAKLVARFEKEREIYRSQLLKFSSFTPKLKTIVKTSEKFGEPAWINDFIPGLDAVALYGFVASRNPAIYMEVGSGNSTKFVRRAITDHKLRTKIVSIDPHPRAEIDAICDVVHRQSFEEMDMGVLSELQAGDVLFVDNSHRSFMNSDVTVFFMEALGALPSKVLYGLHDIHLPMDYPADWVDRFYSEQYLLATYLFGGGAGDSIVLPCAFITFDERLSGVLKPLWESRELQGVHQFGASFWMERSDSD